MNNGYGSGMNGTPRFCGKCGLPLYGGQTVCPRCNAGAQTQTSQQCGKCGAITQSGQQFCHVCGNALDGAVGERSKGMKKGARVALIVGIIVSIVLMAAVVFGSLILPIIIDEVEYASAADKYAEALSEIDEKDYDDAYDIFIDLSDDIYGLEVDEYGIVEAIVYVNSVDVYDGTVVDVTHILEYISKLEYAGAREMIISENEYLKTVVALNGRWRSDKIFDKTAKEYVTLKSGDIIYEFEDGAVTEFNEAMVKQYEWRMYVRCVDGKLEYHITAPDEEHYWKIRAYSAYGSTTFFLEYFADNAEYNIDWEITFEKTK